jgi:type I restriction enzyme, R subunit
VDAVILLPATTGQRQTGVCEQRHPGKLRQSQTLIQQAVNNTKEQFASSPNLKNEIMNAIMAALDAHTTMSTQALDSEAVRDVLRDILPGPTKLYELLRKQVENEGTKA